MSSQGPARVRTQEERADNARRHDDARRALHPGPHVSDPLVAVEAAALVRSVVQVTERFSRLHERLSEEAGEGVDISDEAFERSGADEALRLLHVAQSILESHTGSDGLRADELEAELRTICTQSEAEQPS